MTKHKSSDERREQILSAARQCFIERGYESTSMQDISRRSGLSKGGIYFHFDSKMHVFLSLVEEEYESSMAPLAEIARGSAPLQEKLGALANHYLRNFAAQIERASFFIVMSEVALREPAVKERLLDMQMRYIDLLTEFIEAGMKSGDLRQTNPRAVAIFMKSLMDGLEGNTALGYDLELPSLVPAGVELLLNGLLERPST